MVCTGALTGSLMSISYRKLGKQGPSELEALCVFCSDEAQGNEYLNFLFTCWVGGGSSVPSFSSNFT